MPDVIFTGPEGRLEGRYQHGNSETRQNAPLALILHPHPLYGGTMNNKVVYTLYQTFAKNGFSVLRFNFRGVGRSQGGYDQGQGELSDAASALDWLQAYNPNASQCWVAGFSFGAWIGMQLLMRRPEIAGFISVAPPAGKFDFGFLAPCPSSGLIVHGTADDLVPEPEVAKLAQRLANQKDITVEYRTIPGTGHFFENKLEELGGMVDKYLKKSLKPK
ncbi:alpha/beta hydrolase [Desertibaculum subflavum]|uniref:alpha/beta hydrolase n=1 Tax=Desertibaculum subflavum TaxID=2268458 RepID=UPI000E6648FB